MKVQTLTVVVGTQACNAVCPFCVSKMTPSCGVGEEEFEVDMRNFDIACKFAKQCGVSTILLTGKGEPTLYPSQIDTYVAESSRRDFPFIELQTNGIILEKEKSALRYWFNKGMTTVSLSVVSADGKENTDLICPNQDYNYWNVVELLHSIGYSVRVNCTMTKGLVDSVEKVIDLVDKCRENNVEQLTVRNVTRPVNCVDKEVGLWVDEHRIEWLEVEVSLGIKRGGGTELLQLPHGAKVYDLFGQNVCVNNCLTSTNDPEQIRQLIFFPDGHLRYDWEHKGAIIL